MKTGFKKILLFVIFVFFGNDTAHDIYSNIYVNTYLFRNLM